MKTSKTPKNPGRLFHCCPYGSEESKNHLFKWTDISMVEEMESVKRVVKTLEEDLEVIEKKFKEFEDFKEQTQKEIEGLKCGLLLCGKDREDICVKNKVFIFGGLIMAFGFYVLFS
ncbi:uncharacterized protein LOC110229711 [Arabidopsis lyrata subsp. lyrata]|uniref:uncharacterized protein LOC110227819 n=1 Tax=Arabidopsis lyrata subsp. lyrata TaxID=81972 RepID=UPI000A29D20B|nr:uncharacterized protein LOC110227819 [Arabidopsis lyrata subsp. lyrata]XP_020879740.1 uncharacterized protein LOC110228030 [Arabidopsis lyrata subsp. lyrata]XP_020882764.1 uncharacterized protein LOC110228876 [Arabidopsis lyrata subsp. lyrata]XP_020886087.1 uncharacterized protein LOC110229711 [Arabidopsis lyrata subsp. lyrata]|eukprot:XP_020879190.1 uncharacterized protein LOC110227819 [Arabidopsis lyrata subsp. lyrata]